MSSTILSDQQDNSFKQKKELCKTFFETILDLWFKHNQPFLLRDFGHIFSRIDHVLKNNSFYPFNTQTTAGSCITIDYKGDFSTFSPEFIDHSEFILGNITKYNSFDEVKSNQPLLTELEDKINNGVNKCAESCEYFKLCGGGAPSNKYFENNSLESSNTRFCELSIKTLADVIMNRV